MLYVIVALLAANLVTLVVIARRVRASAPAGRFDEAQLRVLQQIRDDARRCVVLHRAAYWRERGQGEPEGLEDALRGES